MVVSYFCFFFPGNIFNVIGISHQKEQTNLFGLSFLLYFSYELGLTGVAFVVFLLLFPLACGLLVPFVAMV